MFESVENYLLYGQDKEQIINKINELPDGEKEVLKRWLTDIFKEYTLNDPDFFGARMDSASFKLSALKAIGAAAAVLVWLSFNVSMNDPIVLVASTVASSGLVGFGIFRCTSAPGRRQARKEIEERITELKELLSGREDCYSKINPLRIPQGGN